jgi:Fe-S cluster assembly protein SufD
MGIQSFLKAKKGDPDWAFTPEQFFDKEFKVIDAKLIELAHDKSDKIVLRQNPTEKELLAKHIQIDVRENATMDLTVINDAADKLQQVVIYDVRLREGSLLNMGMFIKGGRLNKHIIQVTLDQGSNFNAYGYIANWVGGDCEIITKLTHDGENSISNQYIIAEAGEGSQTVFQNMSNILQGADNSELSIENLNILNGRGARCHGLPEIFNDSDSSKVSSGVTTDIIDNDQIYYLQTRGIGYDRAEELLLSGYRKQVINLMPDSGVREEIYQLFNN